MQLDQVAETFIRDHGAEPAFKGYKGFPYTCCLSVNAAVVHGFATDDELKEGDEIVTVGGLHGKIVAKDETTFTVSAGGGARLTYEKSAIARRK